MADGKVVGIGGLFLRADDPGKLSAWYREHLGFTVTAGGEPAPDGSYSWKQEAGETVFSFFGRTNTYFPTDRPVMDRSWRLCDDHVADMQSAVQWTRSQWPHSRTWVLGLNNGALSAAVATASIDDLAGAVLLSCVDEALDRPQKSDRMRVLAVRHRADSDAPQGQHSHAGGRKTLVTVHDERQSRSDVARAGDVANVPQFNGKELQVVDVVARWILTGTAPDEIR